MRKIYGYARISTKQQNIERQVRNILAAYPQADVVTEVFTGTKFQGRDKLDALLRRIKPGDTLVFDSVSRMSRNATEGVDLYTELFNKGVNLVFLKEPHVNSDTYHKALEQQVSVALPDTGDAATNELMQNIVAALNRYTMALARRQIELAFAQSQKEVTDLHARTAEGIQTARLNGKQIGQRQGAKLRIKKAGPAKDIIRRHSRTFGGTLSDTECMQLAGVARNTYYKYKREIVQELGA